MPKDLFSLGKIFPSDFLKPDEQPRCEPVELKLVMEDNGLVHLEKTAPSHVMWGKYFYRSGINETMRSALKDIVDSILPLMKFKENDVWCDVGVNDGSLLSFVPKSFIRVGIDPAEDSYKKESEKHADLILQNYFSASVYKRSQFGNQKVKVLTSVAMLYDVEDVEVFINDVYDILDDEGIWVIQVSYSPLMIEQVAFDNICHEHKYYFSLSNLQILLIENDFTVIDCQLNEVNGGSMRLYVMKANDNVNKFSTQPFRDVCYFRTESLYRYEISNGVGIKLVNTWVEFCERIHILKEEVVSFINKERANGKTIWCYGASTKGNTLLQVFGLDNSIIDGIADRNIDKWRLRTVGTNIPIYSESDMRKAKPDYLLILPWHFINEFKERESEYLKGGGKFIVPCPKFEIISA